MYRIAVMGDKDSIYGFAAAGLDIFPVDNSVAAGRKLKSLAESGYAVIYVTEALCPYISKEIDAYHDSVLPAIIPIPGVSGNSGYGMAQVKKSVEQAIGIDILFGSHNSTR
jgi:V/A-type H+-transporting ATPase subunit F